MFDPFNCPGLEAAVQNDVAAYAEWFKNIHGRYPRPGALQIVEELSGLLMKYESKGAEDAHRSSPPLEMEALSQIVAEDFPEADGKTLAEFASLLRRFYMDGYKAARKAQPRPSTTK